MTLPCWHDWRSRLGVSATLALCCALGAACNSAASAGTTKTQGTAGASQSDAGASSDSEPSPEKIDFVSLGGMPGIVLEPKQTQELTVQTVPPGIFLVHFALPGSGDANGDPGDAALDRNESQTDADGVAHVVLTAPSTPAGFSVRATAGIQSAFQGVQVMSVGYTTLHVMPSYNGQRPVGTWTATATAAMGGSCSQLSGNPPPDGKLIGVSSGPDEVSILRVPVGLDVVVTVRAGHYIGGCATLPPLSEGDDNTVLVYASDRPLNLADTELALAFGPTDAQPAFDKLLGNSTSLIEDSLLGAATSDVVALLDAMRAATPAVDRAAFDGARELGGWDAALGSAFGTSGARVLRDPVERWLKAGLAGFDAANTFTGTLSAAGADAVFKPSLIAGLSPSEAGFAKSFPATWIADSSDTLRLGSELSWAPARLVGALAVAPALLEFPAAQSLSEALASSVDCGLVASVLLAHGTSVGSALYDGCDQSCGASTCVTAINNAWSNAEDASGSSVATLSVTATGSATVGDAAEIVKLDGTWVGQLSDGDAQASTSGTLTASTAAQ